MRWKDKIEGDWGYLEGREDGNDLTKARRPKTKTSLYMPTHRSWKCVITTYVSPFSVIQIATAGAENDMHCG